MQTLVIQHLCDPNPTHVIIECDDTDTCPGCGAGYKVGMSQCEYCRRPVNSWLKPAGPHNQALGIFG